MFACFLFIIATLALLFLYLRAIKGHRTLAVLFWVSGWSLGAWSLTQTNAVPLLDSEPQNEWIYVGMGVLSKALFWELLLPFCAMLYFKWVQGEMTEAEKQAGADGVRAWLSPFHVLWVVAIALCGWRGQGIPLGGGVLLGLLPLLAWPLGKLLICSKPAERPVPEDTSLERERVLRLLEQGKITASESAELLNALATSAQSVRATRSASPQQRLIWLGTTLVLLGFFLPWFSIDTGKEVNRVFQQMQQAMPLGAPQMPQMITGVVQVRGGDIAHGLGWVILVAAVAASVLPYFAPEMDGKKRQMLVLGALAAGTFTLVYLLTDSIRYASIGMLFCLAGYAVCLAGAIKEWRAAAWA